MKFLTEFFLTVLLVALLTALYAFMGERVAVFGGVLAFTWFCIAFVLMTRPPGMPELISEEGSDEQRIGRKDLFEPLAVRDRIKIALGVACGACFLLWITLFFLAG